MARGATLVGRDQSAGTEGRAAAGQTGQLGSKGRRGQVAQDRKCSEAGWGRVATEALGLAQGLALQEISMPPVAEAECSGILVAAVCRG